MEHEIATLVQQALQGSITFEALEKEVRTTALKIGADVLESMLNLSAGPIPPSITLGNGSLSLIHISEPTRPY